VIAHAIVDVAGQDDGQSNDGVRVSLCP
jgi:hypothetical protein